MALSYRKTFFFERWLPSIDNQVFGAGLLFFNLTSTKVQRIFLYSDIWTNDEEDYVCPNSQMCSLQFSHSVVSDSCDPVDCSRPGLPVHRQLQEFTQTHVHWVGDANHLILCHPLLLLPLIFPRIRDFSNESVLCIRWPKYLSFRFSISLSNEYSGCSPLGWIGLISLQSKGLSRVFSNTTVQKYQFFSAQLSL